MSELLRNMIYMVLNECKKNDIKFIWICKGRQWAKNCIKAADNLPLTRTQYQKDAMSFYIKYNKNILLKIQEALSMNAGLPNSQFRR